MYEPVFPCLLGRVRQVVDPAAVALAQSFDPFGQVLAQAGEQTDPTGLVFLRAWYYTCSEGWRRKSKSAPRWACWQCCW
jgi:hypothetical protein